MKTVLAWFIDNPVAANLLNGDPASRRILFAGVDA